MKPNMGYVDRIIRVLIAVGLLIAFFDNHIAGVWGILAVVIAIILIGTSFMGFCPLYKPLGISTRKKQAV